jgi:hypothetical protein
MATSHRIVVGVDFGTTFRYTERLITVIKCAEIIKRERADLSPGGLSSALAWASSYSPDQIEIIRNWPSSGQLVGPQAPTEIAYEDGSTSGFSWGYDIPPNRRKVRESPRVSC